MIKPQIAQRFNVPSGWHAAPLASADSRRWPSLSITIKAAAHAATIASRIDILQDHNLPKFGKHNINDPLRARRSVAIGVVSHAHPSISWSNWIEISMQCTP